MGSAGVLAGLVVLEGILIYQISEGSDRDDKEANLGLMVCNLSSLGIKGVNSLLNYLEFWHKKQEAAFSKLDAAGRALELLEDLQGNKEEVCRLGIKAGEIEARVGREVDDEVTRLQRAAEGYKRDVAGIFTTRNQEVSTGNQGGTTECNKALRIKLVSLWKEQPSLFREFFENLGRLRLEDTSSNNQLNEARVDIGTVKALLRDISQAKDKI